MTDTARSPASARSSGGGGRGVDRRGEVRLPASVATVLAIGLYAALPDRLIVGPRLVVPVLEAALLLAVVLVNPWRVTRATRWSRLVSLALIALIAAGNLTALGLLVHALLPGHQQSGPELLTAALQVWVTDVLVFALAFWELDRGGPVSRQRRPRPELPDADFRFSQDEDHDTVEEVARGASVRGWVPTFVDYLYVSLTNSSAFSPTDTMPLSARAKVLMGTEATAALLTSLLVVAGGVGQLK